MADVETVKIKHGKSDYAIINKSDYDPKEHALYQGELDDAVDDGLGGGRNPSGTFSEPTPTDIRYPDKDLTEFENNHGAFVGRSAAELRAKLGLPDAPGGLAPDLELLHGAAHEGVALSAEVISLRGQVQDLQSQLAEANRAKAEGADGMTDAALKAVHRGGGSYSIMRGDEPVEDVEKLTKEDAEAFNAMSDADKAAYIAKRGE